jgi:hypothetical protein
MAYNYLELVNQINRRLNETELTSSNFASATGFYAQCKDAINASLRDINQHEFNWPFNHVEQEDVLSSNVTRYPFPHDAKLVDFDSFRIKEDSSLGNATTRLGVLAYEEYLDKYVDQEYNTNGRSGVPQMVAHGPALEYLLTPEPDKAYTVVYEYYRVPVDLELYDDVPAVPERFKHVIVDGAMHYAYLFRGNSQDAMVAKQKFDEGIKNMRIVLINRTYYLRSTMIPQNTGGGRMGFSRSVI